MFTLWSEWCIIIMCMFVCIWFEWERLQRRICQLYHVLLCTRIRNESTSKSKMSLFCGNVLIKCAVLYKLYDDVVIKKDAITAFFSVRRFITLLKSWIFQNQFELSYLFAIHWNKKSPGFKACACVSFWSSIEYVQSKLL